MALANPIMNPRLLEGLKTIVFDNDGVLIDSYEANMRYYGAIKEQLGLPPMTDAEKVFVHTRTHNEAVRHIVSADQVDRAFEIVGGFDSSSLQQYLKRSIGIREFAVLASRHGVRSGRQHQPRRIHGHDPGDDGFGGLLPSGHHLLQGQSFQAASGGIVQDYAGARRSSARSGLYR